MYLLYTVELYLYGEFYLKYANIFKFYYMRHFVFSSVIF